MLNYRILILFIIPFLSWCSVFGQVIRPSYFKIHHEKGDSYLLGTVHAGVSLQEFPESLNLTSRIKNARLVFAERAVSLNDINSFLYQPLQVMKNYSPYLPTHPISPFTREKLIHLGLTSELLLDVSDSDCGVLAALVYMRMTDLPLDLEILQVAHQNQTAVLGLDTNELIRRANDELNRQEACSLESIFREHSSEQIVSSILAQTLEAITIYRLGIPEPEESLASPLLVMRNIGWMEKIVPELSRGNIFIAVGQSHIYGDQGLVNLLRSRGFQVEEVSP